jgi:hypothetical protein
VNPCINNHFYRLLILTYLFLASSVLTAFAQDSSPADTISRSFYDSLRIKAEKRRITSLLYDMIFISPAADGIAREKMKNTSFFDEYEGRVIRKRELIRLNAFGTVIDDPLVNNPSKVEKTLNSTYTKTRRFVLNQYLLFHEGDTISSLKMADNERLLRELPFIDDARITIVPVDEKLADVAVIVRETYPIGFDLRINDISSGRVTLFDRNFAGLGHELNLIVPYNLDEYPYPGFGMKYAVRNIARSLSDLELDYSNGLGSRNMGGLYRRSFVTSETKYAWSASVRLTYTTEDLDTMLTPAPLRYLWQDYWAARSFMLDRTTVTRLVIAGRYINNNVFKRPEINDFSYYRLQRYQLITASLSVTSQRFINTSLIYCYGRTEDIPYGYMIEGMYGREINEFKWRTYAGIKASYGNIISRFGYIYGGMGFSTFYNHGQTEQGMFETTIRYFTPLIQAGRSRIRTFMNLHYLRGFNRYTDEWLYLHNNDLVRGFSNDSIHGNTRIVLSLEPVLFVFKPLIGFRFALFAFVDAGFLVNGGITTGKYYNISAIGTGVRIRNDQLVLNTIQIRLAYYPNVPPYSESSWITMNGLVRLKPPGFDPEPPGVIPFQ